jgi:hypothetical protein
LGEIGPLRFTFARVAVGLREDWKATRMHRTYVLKQCPTIKGDVEFSISGNEAEDKLTQISKPHLDYGHCD